LTAGSIRKDGRKSPVPSALAASIFVIWPRLRDNPTPIRLTCYAIWHSMRRCERGEKGKADRQLIEDYDYWFWNFG
jgi:hypothetical protein